MVTREVAINMNFRTFIFIIYEDFIYLTIDETKYGDLFILQFYVQI